MHGNGHLTRMQKTTYEATVARLASINVSIEKDAIVAPPDIVHASAVTCRALVMAFDRHTWSSSTGMRTLR